MNKAPWPSAGSALTLGCVLAGCEQPVRPAAPSPLQAAADHFDVPVGVLGELQRTAERIEAPQGTRGPRSALAPAEAQRLRRVMDSLQKVQPAEQPSLFKRRRVPYWQNADQRMDFTTRDDTAAFTAAAAVDPSTPRILRIAGGSPTARGLAALMTEISGERYRLLRAGSLRTLGVVIRVARTVAPQRDALYPAWQGMQYMRDMFDGRGQLQPLDNGRYPALRRTSAREVLAGR
jgi:hypothetical protein